MENEVKSKISGNGHIIINGNEKKYNILVISIIGEIEGHDALTDKSKSTKYEEVLPNLAVCEDDTEIKGVLVLLNTLGGDVEAGLAIAEMLASLSKPVVTLVLGGSHSIGVPLAVAGDISLIVPTATMVVHPIRMSGVVLGTKQNYEYIEKMQDRIINFTIEHSNIEKEKFEKIMFNTNELSKDVGSVLVGEEAVNSGIIDYVGGISDAFTILYDLINCKNNSKIVK